MICIRYFVILFWLLLFAACGSREVLPPRSAANTHAVSFAGRWQLAGDASELTRKINTAIRQTDGVRDSIRIIPRQRRPGQPPRRVDGGLVYVFFEDGESLRITQTPHALFVSFDRAVVEEYRFGENRHITVGQAEAQRVSGWENGDYVIETLDRSGMKLTERYRLRAGGDELLRRITFRGRNKEAVTVEQVFRRNAG